MVSTKQRYRYQFKDEITIDFLQSTYIDHEQIAEELALAQIHSLELAMPRFNTLASLNKAEFNRFMSNIKRTYKDSKTFTVMVAALSDTFTCMIENSKFYENYAGDNKNGLELMMGLLQTLKLVLVTYGRAIESKQLETLIEILEKSAERIKKEQEYYKIMLQIISSLRTHMRNQLGQESKLDVQKTETETKVKNNIKPQILHKDDIKENFQPALPLLNDKRAFNNNNTSPVDCKMDCIITNTSSTEPVQKQVINPAVHTAPLKPQISNKKPSNAFELMMMSSKLMGMKRKGTA